MVNVNYHIYKYKYQIMYTFLFFLIKSNSIKGIFCKILNNRCFILCFGSYLRGQKAVFAQNIKTFRQYVVFNNFRETKMIITGLKVSVYTAEFCCCNSGSVQVLHWNACVFCHYTWVQGIPVFLLLILSPCEMRCIVCDFLFFF